MGNTESNVTSGVKKQADTSSIQIYKFVDLKGGGLLVDMMKRAAASKQYAELDHAIKTKVEPFLYNKGKGRLIPVAQLVLLRNKDRPKHKMLPQLKAMENPDDYDIDNDFTTVVNEDEKHDPSKYRDVCWDLKERGAVGETILHLCLLNATSIHADLAKRLLRFYPKLINDIYMSDEYYGENVLHIAIVNEDPSMVKFLLDSGVNYHERCCGTFMCPEDQKASRYDSLDHEWVNVSPLTNYEGYVYWGEYPLAFAACLGQEECYRLMLARGANPDNQDTNGNTVLHLLVIYEKMSTFDMAYEVGASLAIRNNLGLTPLTLAAKLARIDIFFHILNIEREIYWQIGSITCAAYPLSQIDTIDIETGNISKNSALNLVVFGDKDEHLELMDGVLVDLLVAKWNAYVKFRFYRQFTLFFLYFLVSLLCFTLRPGPPTKAVVSVNSTLPPTHNVSIPPPSLTGLNASEINSSLPIRVPSWPTPAPANAPRKRPPASTHKTTPLRTTTTSTTLGEPAANPGKTSAGSGNTTDKLATLPSARGKSKKKKPSVNETVTESVAPGIINATKQNASAALSRSAGSEVAGAVKISISLLAEHDADPDALTKHANQVYRGELVDGASERVRYGLAAGGDADGNATAEGGNPGLSKRGARVARAAAAVGTAAEDAALVKNLSLNGTSGNATDRDDEPWWEELADCRLMKFRTLKAQVRLGAEMTMELGSVLYLLAALREARFLGLHMFVENLMTAPSRVMFLLSCVSMQVVPFLRLSCRTEEEDVVAVFIMLTTAPYFLFFCRGFKTVGPFVVMIYRMIMGDLLRFVSIYLVFVMGFSQAYYIIFLSFDNPNTPEGVDDSTANPMSSPMESIMAMFLMSMTNFGDYYGAFERTDHEILAKCLFVIYMGIVAILLVNMLIAMMGNTYQKIAETRNEWQRQWARIVLVVERGVSPQERLKKLMWYSQPMSDGRRALVLRLNQTEEDKDEMKEILEMKRVHVRMVKKRQMGINKLHSNTPSPKSKKI